MGFRQIAIAGFIIVAAFLFLQGLGTQYGLVSQITPFTDTFPSNHETQCDWADRGVFHNVNVTDECFLEIRDLGTFAEDQDVIRISVDSATEWNSHYTLRDNFEVETENGAFLTPSMQIDTVEIPDGVDFVKSQNRPSRFDTTTLSTSFTVDPGSDRLLILTLGLRNENANLQSATYAGQNLNILASQPSGEESKTIVAYLVNPPTGSNTLSFTLSAKSQGQYGAIQLNDVLQSNPFSNFKKTSSTGSITTSLVTESGDMVLDAASSRDAISPASGQTLIFNVPLENQRDHAASYKKTSGSTSMTWNGVAGEAISQVSMNVQSSVTEKNVSRYFTSRFFAASAAPLDASYEYNFTSSPTSARADLYNTETDTVVDSLNLTGVGGGESVATFTVPTDGVYQFRVYVEGGEYGEQKFYNFRATQDSAQLENISIGEYSADPVRTASEVQLNRIRFVGDNIVRHGIQPGERPRTVQLEVQGLRAGQIVDEAIYEVDDGGFVVSDNPFPGEDITGYNFDVYLISENGENPRFESVVFSGTEYDRAFSREVAEWVKTVLFVIFVGMAIVYLALEVIGF